MSATPRNVWERPSPAITPALEAAADSWDLADDASLADAILSDGLARARAGQSLDLAEYLRIIPGLAGMPESLDAAISVTLASMNGLARTAEERAGAAETLAARHPTLRARIFESEALNRVAAAARAYEALSEDDDSMLPRGFGPLTESGGQRYRLMEFIGAGAFGHVYLANDLELGEDSSPALVALKVLHSGHGPEVDDGIAEAKSARRVDHPNVVRVLNRGVAPGGERFIVFEYVSGGSLAEALRADPPPWQPRRAARLIAEIARGLQAVHAVGLLHCDLKPGNILLTPGGTPRITDFGVAIRNDQLVRARFGFSDPGVFGNLAFVSPEQFHGSVAELGPHSDVYALSGILYFMLTGNLPNGGTRAEIARAHDRPAVARSAPELVWPARSRDVDLEAICRRGLAPRPRDRYASAGEFASDLESWLGRHTLAWTKPSMWRTLRLASLRNPVEAFTLAALLGSLVVGSVVSTTLYLMHLEDHARVQQGTTEANPVP